VIDLTRQTVKSAELARENPFRYQCWDCGHEFPIRIKGAEERGSLSEGRREACPNCGQPVGKGRIACRRCQAAFVVTLPHWHVSCDLAAGICPVCGEAYDSACIC
jgi:DNA-directed RNA polymerase subunit RPC12/RpoP